MTGTIDGSSIYALFTFQYGSTQIISLCTPFTLILDLHSNMDLLKYNMSVTADKRIFNLHSNMDLLKYEALYLQLDGLVIFTFQYGSTQIEIH